jgi:NADH:ubiquinone oxidoreductase subunit 5 (subunit L)/multisubunit Na+/H+ antiporter MnhA subunit
MEFLILLLPLCSALIAGLSGDYIDKNITAILSVLSITSCCLLSISTLFSLMSSHNIVYLNLGN